MKLFNLAFAVSVFPFSLAACDNSADKKVENSAAIENEYRNYVIDGSATNLACQSKVVQNSEFVLCSYGDGQWPHRGLWMVDGGRYYALNGKALSALEKLKSNSSFSTLPSRVTVDVSGVMRTFEGGEVDSKLVSESSENEVSKSEVDAYCAYSKEKDLLTIQANSRFGADNPLSEKRAEWIEPKIMDLRKKHFEQKGMQYFSVFEKVTGAGVTCPG